MELPVECLICKVNIYKVNIVRHYTKCHIDIAPTEFKNHLSLYNLTVEMTNDFIEKYNDFLKNPKPPKPPKRIFPLIQLKRPKPGKPEFYDSKKTAKTININQEIIDKITISKNYLDRLYKNLPKFEYKVEGNKSYEEFKYEEFKKIEKIELNKLLNDNKNYEMNYFINENIPNYSKLIDDYLHSVPSAEEFKNRDCNVVYLTWDNFSFEKDKVRIIYPSLFVKSFQLNGINYLLDNIKKDYFKRIYPKQIFKFYIFKGEIVKEISKGYNQLLSILEIGYEAISFKIEKKYFNNKNENKEYQSKEIREILAELQVNNNFLNYLAQKAINIDSVYCIVENNNGNEEECLLFKFVFDSKIILIWENVIDKRATYYFILDKIIDAQEIHKIFKLIQSDLNNKRESLYGNFNLNKVFDIDILDYHSIRHDDLKKYQNKIDKLLSMYKR